MYNTSLTAKFFYQPVVKTCLPSQWFHRLRVLRSDGIGATLILTRVRSILGAI